MFEDLVRRDGADGDQRVAEATAPFGETREAVFELEGKERFRSDSSFRTYLFGVAHNLLRDHYRARRRTAVSIDFTETSAEDTGVGPNTLVGKRREQRLLLEALRRIPIDSQIVLELYYWEEMSASQTAAVLGLPEGTVRGRVRRAKQLLKQQLGRLAVSAEELDTTVNGLEGWAASLREVLAKADGDLES